MEEYLTVKELSQRIKLAVQTIYNFIHEEKFILGEHYLKPTPKKILFRWSAIKEWMGEGTDVRYSKNRIWSEAEKEIVLTCAHLTLKHIARKFREGGFARSENAIKLFITRKLGCKPRVDYSLTMLSRLLGIDSHTVMRWVSIGLLKAERKGTMRIAAQGGDSYLITPEDAREFVIGYLHLVDFRKVDKYWLTELLTGREIIFTA